MYNTCHLNMYVHLHACVFRFSRLLYSQFSLYIYIIIFYISKFNVFNSLRLGFRLVIEWRAVKVITIDNDFCIVLRCGRCKCFPVFLYIFFFYFFFVYILYKHPRIFIFAKFNVKGKVTKGLFTNYVCLRWMQFLLL